MKANHMLNKHLWSDIIQLKKKVKIILNDP